jgi:hypothetical protein
MPIVYGLIYSSWIVDIFTYLSICSPGWLALIWKTKTLGYGVVVPCWFSSYLCSTTYSTALIGSFVY